MFGDITPLAILFRLLNFSVLIGFFYYMYNRYIKQDAQETMQEQETVTKGLQELNYMLEGQLLELEDKMRAQYDYGNQLKEKVQEWRHAIDRVAHKEKEHSALLRERIVHRLQERQAQVIQVRNARYIVPQALAQARSQLEKKFTSPEKQAQFLKDTAQKVKDL